MNIECNNCEFSKQCKDCMYNIVQKQKDSHIEVSYSKNTGNKKTENMKEYQRNWAREKRRKALENEMRHAGVLI